MKKLCLLVLATVLLSKSASAQITAPTMTVKKFVGDTVTFSWDYLVADEATMTHFSLKWVDSLTGTFIELKQIPKTARSTTTPASFTPGFKFTYYAVTAVDARVASSPIESGPSNTVATERVGKPPTNHAVQ